MKTNGKPPRLRQLRWLREIFLMTQPPLLAVVQGGELRLIPIHSSYDRRYSIRVIRAIRGSDLTYGISLVGLDGRYVCRYVTDLGSSSTESQQFRSSSPQVLHRSE